MISITWITIFSINPIVYQNYFFVGQEELLRYKYNYINFEISKFNSLEASSLGILSKANQSRSFTTRISHFWEVEGYKDLKRNALICTLFRSNIWRILWIFLLSAVVVFFELVSVLLLREIMSYFQNQNNNKYSLLTLSILFIISNFLNIITNRHNSYSTVNLL